jgi:glucokinase
VADQVAGAIDIGGTHIRVSLVSDRGEVLTAATLPTLTGAGSAQVCVRRMHGQLVRQCAQRGLGLADLRGVGIVCAGPIDCRRGEIHNPYTLPGWEAYNIVASLRACTGLLVTLEHDVNGALLGEVFLNSWQGKRVLMISFGTGIGVAVYDRDRSFRAGTTYHPEMGHVVVDACLTNACYCRHGGCFESLWSGSALQARAQALGYASFDDLFARWQAGETAAQGEMERLQRYFRAGVWNLMTIFKPDILVLGGGLMQRYYDFCAGLIRRDLDGLEDFVESYQIFPMALEDGSAVVGASRLVFGDAALTA